MLCVGIDSDIHIYIYIHIHIDGGVCVGKWLVKVMVKVR